LEQCLTARSARPLEGGGHKLWPSGDTVHHALAQTVGLEQGEEVSALRPHVFQPVRDGVLGAIVAEEGLVAVAKPIPTVFLLVAGRHYHGCGGPVCVSPPAAASARGAQLLSICSMARRSSARRAAMIVGAVGSTWRSQ
jgi:hypothetical protein